MVDARSTHRQEREPDTGVRTPDTCRSAPFHAPSRVGHPGSCETTYSGYMTDRSTSTPGMVLGTSEGRPYRFDPGALCLELLVTGGPAAPTPYEALDRPAALVRWAGESRLAPGLGAVLAVDEADVRAARAVRDALLRITADRAGGHRFGRPADASDFAVLNAAAAEARSSPGWARTGRGSGLPGRQGRSCCRPSRAMPWTSSRGRTRTVSANAARTTATCCSSTPRGRAVAAGARWSGAGISTRSGPIAPAVLRPRRRLRRRGRGRR